MINEKKPYPGSKTAAGSLQKILSEIPKCEIFIDCMTGGGTVAKSVKGCQVIANDIDPKTIADFDSSNLENFSLVNRGYTELLAEFDNGSASRVFYFDPPYLISSRNSKNKMYRYQWNDNDHEQFFKVANGIKCPAMISHFECAEYNQAFESWRKITYRAMTRGGVRIEALYLNYAPPLLLQCFEYAGENFTDRQRIKRKVDRLTARLQREDEKERAVILSSIISNFSFITHKK